MRLKVTMRDQNSRGEASQRSNQDKTSSYPFAGLSPENLEAIVRFWRGRNVALPKWNGISQDFVFYIQRLEFRIEVDYAPFLDEPTICLDLIETLPETLKMRVASWLSKRRSDGRFSWKDLISHFKDTFMNRQVRQAASEFVSRMEQGENQFFADFFLDFECRVSQCGEEAYTPLGKTCTLKAAMNNRLRAALVGVKLPPPEAHDDWVDAVKEVALDLEALPNYCPEGAIQTTTRLGAPKSGVGQVEMWQNNRDQPIPDAEEDLEVGDTKPTLAATQNVAKRVKKIEVQTVRPSLDTRREVINEKERASEGEELPHAPRQTQDELHRLNGQGVCLQCTQGEHRAENCPNVQSASPPKISLTTATKKSGLELEISNIPAAISQNCHGLGYKGLEPLYTQW